MKRIHLILLFAVFAGCSSGQVERKWVFNRVPLDFAEGSRTPFLFQNDSGAVWIGYQAEKNNQKSIRLKSLADGGDYAVFSDTAQLINFADYPQFAFSGEKTIRSFALISRPSRGFHYDLKVFSVQTEPFEVSPASTPYPEDIDAEHGFGSFAEVPEGGHSMVWIDGRKFIGSGEGHDHSAGESELRGVFLSGDGRVSEPVTLDERICDCCRTASVSVDGRVLVFYRDRSEAEVRDISVVRYENGSWSKPEPFSEDSWVISGCPVNGPSAVACCDRVYVAWFTAALGNNAVKYAWSYDGGKSFSDPVTVATGAVSGRVAMAIDGDHTAYLAWLQRDSTDVSRLMLSRVTRGSYTRPEAIATMDDARKTGFPGLLVSGKTLYAIYTGTNGIELIETAL